jgi:hypothetical protein
MQTESFSLNETSYDRAIRTKIAQELRAQYDLSRPLPHRFLTLLMQLNEPQDEAASDADKRIDISAGNEAARNA